VGNHNPGDVVRVGTRLVVAADELLKGVIEREEAATTRQIALLLHSLMDKAGRQVILSSMDATLINSGKSPRQPLFLAAGQLDYDAVETYMKRILDVQKPCLGKEELWKLRAIWAMSSGHARTLGRILNAVEMHNQTSSLDPLTRVSRSMLLRLASGAAERPSEVFKRGDDGQPLHDSAGVPCEHDNKEVSMCAFEFSLQCGVAQAKAAVDAWSDETLPPMEDGSMLSVSELISAGYAHTAAIQGNHDYVEGDCELFALDIIAANLHQFVQSAQASAVCAARFPALRLLCEALEAPRIPLPSADLGERCYMYAGAFALSCPDAGPLEAVFPGLDAALKAESESEEGKGDGFGWTNGGGGEFSTVNLSQ